MGTEELSGAWTNGCGCHVLRGTVGRGGQVSEIQWKGRKEEQGQNGWDHKVMEFCSRVAKEKQEGQNTEMQPETKTVGWREKTEKRWWAGRHWWEEIMMQRERDGEERHLPPEGAELGALSEDTPSKDPPPLFLPLSSLLDSYLDPPFLHILVRY